MRSDLIPYILTDKRSIACYDEMQAALLAGEKRSVIDNAVAYDLIKILEGFEESYRIDRNTSLGRLHNSPIMASHGGADYNLSSIKLNAHNFPTLGLQPLYQGGFQIDAANKRVLYNLNAMVDGRDSYFLGKNSFQTQTSLEDIINNILSRGYKLFQATYVGVPYTNEPLHPDTMEHFFRIEALKRLFFEQTGFSPREAYMVEGPITLADIQAKKFLEKKGRPKYSTQEELIDILKAEHWGVKKE